MPEYEKMYAILCAAASEAVDALDAGEFSAARKRLLEALAAAEELYVGVEEGAGDESSPA